MAKRPSYKVYPVTFAVKGRGEFPFDMLRYDACFPATGDDVSMLEKQYEYETANVVGIAGGSRRAIDRTVHLTMLSRNYTGPTIERWKSFGWTVIDDSMG
jgi:hypothetical protein